MIFEVNMNKFAYSNKKGEEEERNKIFFFIICRSDSTLILDTTKKNPYLLVRTRLDNRDI